MALRLHSWPLLLGTALVLRVLLSVAVVAGWPLVSDGSAYSEQAEQMVREFPGTEPYYWPPGTSYVLWVAYELFGAGRTVARATMVLISVGSVAATVLLARRVLRSETAAWRAGWVMALLPPAVFMPSQPFSFDLTMLGLLLCLLGLLLAWERGEVRWAAGAGLALGVAATARPGVLSVLLALVPVSVVAARRRLHAQPPLRPHRLAAAAVAFTALLVAPLVPAVLHNAALGAGATVSTNNEGNLLFGNNPYTPDYKTWDQGQRELDELEPEERAYLEEHFTAGGSPEDRRHMRDQALDYVRAEPARTAWRTLNRARAFWGFDYTYSNGLHADASAPLPAIGAAALLEVGGWLVLGALALVGLVQGRGQFRPGRLALVLLVVGAYQLPHLAAFSAGRWHQPVLPLLALLAAAGLSALGSPREALPVVRQSKALLVALGLFLLIQVEYGAVVVTDALGRG